jgi:acetyl esterase/lipase
VSVPFVTAAAKSGLIHDQACYGPGPDQIAEILRPAAEPAGLVVVIHGGFWRSTYDHTHTVQQCLALARAGYLVAALEYRRVGGGGGWPTTFADVSAGVDALPALTGNASQRPILIGHSAGGHLALWAAGRHRLPPSAPGHLPLPTTPAHRTSAGVSAPPDPGTPPPAGSGGGSPALRGVIALGAVADLHWSYRHTLGAGAALDLLGVDPAADPGGRWAAADPARLLPTGIRAILLHGAADDLVPPGCAESYAHLARAAGDDCDLRVLPGVGHFEFIDPTSTAWPHVLAAIAELST